MQVGVLGPITVSDGAGDASLSPQLRRLLGLLVVADGQVVSTDRLALFIADGRTEGSAVRTAVSRLRKVVGERVIAVGGGYRFEVGGELDLVRFRELRTRAAAAPAEERVGLLREALKLWRGSAFGEHASEEWAVVAAQSAEQSKADCLEDLCESLVAVGRGGEAVELLEPHVVDQPFRERPVALLMEALAGIGRTAAALRAFERFRLGLRDEVGLDPSAGLRALERELLAPGDDPVPERSAASDLPEGTVTFLFTDIVGSTQRWQSDEAAMGRDLAAHDDVLAEAIAEAGGWMFKHTGDGVCAVFRSAPAGVDAAQTALQRLGLPVRMGLHTGEAELRGGDYYGPTLNRAARIMDAGHGGQLLVSGSTASLLANIDLVDLGEHQLKGLETPERVFQVGHHTYPPLRAEGTMRGNLPMDPSPFIGRHDELDTLTTLTVDHRLVSLTGVGGTGKTRLAMTTARSLAPAFPDGCWLVELAETGSADQVPLTFASAFGMADTSGADPMSAVTKLLGRKRALVVVDNCEHVLAAAGDAVETILATCPSVTILATSREPLMVPDERLAPTPSLSKGDAIELFLDRAKAEAPDLVLDDTQHAAASEICDRLDGLPLAIELAAARLRSMTPVEIERRLDERFRLLVGGRRTRIERHRTMTAALDWSFELCSPAEQTVFARLSVFAAEFGMGDALAVVADQDISEFDAEDAIAILVDRSLTRRVVGKDGASKFRLLETMRAYGHQHLIEEGDADTRRQRHAEHIDRTLCQLSFEQFGPSEQQVRASIRALIPEIAAAVTWSIDRKEWTRAYRLASATSVAAWGTSVELSCRLSEAIDADAEASADLGHLRTFILEWTMRLAQGFTDPSAANSPSSGPYRSHNEMLAAEHHLVEDHVGYPVVLFGSTISQDDTKETELFIDRFAGHEVHRCYLEYMLLEIRSRQSTSDVALRRVERLEPRLEHLGSRDMRRRIEFATGSLLERSGQFERAADHLAMMLEGLTAATHHFEVLGALRYLRIAARAGRTITGADFRRPWEWLDAAPGLVTGQVAAILNTSLALAMLGQHDLAKRFGLQVPPSLRPWFAEALPGDPPPEWQALFNTEEPASESLENAKAELFRFAETL